MGSVLDRLRPVGDHLESVSVSPCGLIRLRGAFAGPGPTLPLGTEPGVFLGLGEPRHVDVEALSAALARPGADLPIGIRVALGGLSDEGDGLDLWLALHEPDIGRLMAMGVAASSGIVPPLFSAPGQVATDVLLGAHGCAALMRRAASGDGPGPFELVADRLVPKARSSPTASPPSSAPGTLMAA